MPEDILSPEVLRNILRYEPETGRLFWRERGPEMFAKCKNPSRVSASFNAKFLGAEALFHTDSQGYRRGGIFGRSYAAHRVIWAMQTGRWPTALIDHEDNDRGNNRWINLREATNLENARNTRSSAGSSSKFLGVVWDKRHAKWHVRIMVDRRSKHVGYFTDEEEAARAYDVAARRHFGKFANPNFPDLIRSTSPSMNPEFAL